MNHQVTHRTGLTLMSLLLGLAVAFPAAVAAAGEPESEDERPERSERGSGSSTDLGSYRVGAPGSSRVGGLERRGGDAERPEIDREGLRLDRGEFALEPAYGSSGGIQMDMDIRPSRADRSDRRVVDEEEPREQERQRTRSRVQEQDLQPLMIEAPRYPRQAFRSRTEGYVRVSFTVGSDGKTQDVRVVESSPGTVFDSSAVQAVERWEFEPRIVNGRAVETPLTQTIDFTLDD